MSEDHRGRCRSSDCCRPKGVSNKLEQGATDTQDATLHSNGKMIESVYDRRRVRVAKSVL